MTGAPPDGDPELTGPAPGVFSRAAVPEGPLPPLHDADVVTTLHADWARAAAAPAEDEKGPAPAPGGGRVRAKVRARVAGAGAASAAFQQQDRALIGSLIRAVDALARRLDDQGARLVKLEALVQEVVDKLSEDVVRLQVAVERSGGPGSPVRKPAMGGGEPADPPTGR